MGYAINDAETSYFDFVNGKCSTSIKSNVGITQYKRIGFKAVIKKRILNNEDVGALGKDSICMSVFEILSKLRGLV